MNVPSPSHRLAAIALGIVGQARVPFQVTTEKGEIHAT